MARIFSLFVMLLFATASQAQKSPKIKNFSVEMDIVAGMTATKYHYVIDNKGKGTYTHTQHDSVKTIQFTLSKKQYTDLEQTIVNKAGIYDIPDKVNCDYCADGVDITIRVHSNQGDKTVTGNNPQRVNDDVNNIYKLIKSLVSEESH